MKISKIYLFSAVLLCVGLVVFLIGFAMLGFDVRNFDTEPVYVAKTYTASGATKSITIDDCSAIVKLVASSDEKVHIKYYENDINIYEITDLSGEVNIKALEKNKFIGISVSNPTITVSLPAAFAGKINIDSQDGDIFAENIKAAVISAETENGHIRFTGVTVDGNLELSSENGNLEIYETVSNSTANFSTEKGNIFAQKLSSADLFLETETGHITLADVSASGSVFGECENGDTRISNLSIGTAATLISENGDIKGNVAGSFTDYSYNCDAKNGSCNLPIDWILGKKQLNLCAENGDIDVVAEGTLETPGNTPNN